jgi:hypothetical protein
MLMMPWLGCTILSVCLKESQLIAAKSQSDAESKSHSISFSHLQIAGMFASTSSDACMFITRASTHADLAFLAKFQATALQIQLDCSETFQIPFLRQLRDEKCLKSGKTLKIESLKLFSCFSFLSTYIKRRLKSLIAITEWCFVAQNKPSVEFLSVQVITSINVRLRIDKNSFLFQPQIIIREIVSLTYSEIVSIEMTIMAFAS